MIKFSPNTALSARVAAISLSALRLRLAGSGKLCILASRRPCTSDAGAALRVRERLPLLFLEPLVPGQRLRFERAGDDDGVGRGLQGSTEAQPWPTRDSSEASAEEAISEAPSDKGASNAVASSQKVSEPQRLSHRQFIARGGQLSQLFQDGFGEVGLFHAAGPGKSQDHGVLASLKLRPDSNGHSRWELIASQHIRLAGSVEETLPGQPGGGRAVAAKVELLEEYGVHEDDTEEVSEISPMIDKWADLVRKRSPSFDKHLTDVMAALGEAPCSTDPGTFAFWAVALLNPVPGFPQPVAHELRPSVLAAPTVSSRLFILRRGLQASLRHLRGTHPLF